MAIADIASGINDSLEDLVKRRLFEQMQAAQIQHLQAQEAADRARVGLESRRVSQGDRSLDQSASQFESRLGLDKDEFGFKKQVYGDAAGQRAADLAQTTAQTGELLRRPAAEEITRNYTTQRDKTQHGYRLGEIGAQRQGGDSGQFTSVQQVVGPDGKPAMVVVDRRNNSATPVQMPQGFEPNRPARPVTGAERQTLNYFNRMLEAEKNARAIEDKIGNWDSAVSDAPGIPGFIENWLHTDAGQKYVQAQRMFTEARLRKESGAAIPENEFANDRRMNFRSSGDKPETLTQKRTSRVTTMRGLGNAAGRALQEYYGENANLDDLLKEFSDQPQGKIRARDPQGGLHEAPAGTPLPQGWKIEK